MVPLNRVCECIPHATGYIYFLCVYFLATFANRKGIRSRERQTSREGLRRQCCQWEMGSNIESLFRALTIIRLPSLLLHSVIGESRCNRKAWCSSVSPSLVAPACGKWMQCYSAAGVCWASWPRCILHPLLTCLALHQDNGPEAFDLSLPLPQ